MDKLVQKGNKNVFSKDDPLKTVREFQRKYRNTIPHHKNLEYKWETNPPSSVGEVKQRNYSEGSQSIL